MGSARGADRQCPLPYIRQAKFGMACGRFHRFGGGEKQGRNACLGVNAWSV